MKASNSSEGLFSKNPISLTENQFKVIKDKYLRGAPTVEEWLYGVAHNIALSELLFNFRPEWNLFDGVNYNFDARTRLLSFHDKLNSIDDRRQNFNRLIKNLERAYSEYFDAKKLVDEQCAIFYNMMSHWDFLPNTPTLMNAGRPLQQLSACYVIPVDDSIDGINKALSAQSVIHSSGGGTGFSFSSLRAKGDEVGSVQGVASGAVAFMQIFDKMTDVIKQGGSRRGANMGILHYTHPEIRQFITMKSQTGILENFNVSVTVDDRFIKLVKENAEYDLINPKTGQSVERVNAKEIFDLIVEYAWKSGDPGIIFIDRINNSDSNTTLALGQISATNPCGEKPLLPWEPCNLGSINLSNFVKGDIGKGELDYPRLFNTIYESVRFLDNVIEINNYPLPEIEKLAKGNRRIGLGVMGLAETLVKVGIAYDSPESLDFCSTLMKNINDAARTASIELAKTRGVFPNWTESTYDPKSEYFRGNEHHVRHCARTTIAPTGTIAIAAGLQGSGIEPFFAIVYTRYNAEGLKALKEEKELNSKDVFFEVNPLFKEVAAENNYFGLTEIDLWKKIENNHKSVRGIPEIPVNIQKLFASAHDVSTDFHVKIQAAFQWHTDDGVSKTVNMPNTSTIEDVRRAYLLAHELGCKGITIYRDGSKSQQVLNLASKPSKMKRKDNPFGVSSEYYQIATGYGPLHIHINYDERGPSQIFTNLPPLGTEISGLTSLIGILLSKYLAEGGDPIKILKHLNAIKGDKPLGFGEKRIDSIAHAISVALREHLKKNGWLNGDNSKIEMSTPKAQHCSKCYSSNVSYESGCSEPSCKDCGYSKCS